MGDMDIKGDAFTEAELVTLGLVGLSHFTSMLVEDHAVRGWSLHLERLQRDCRRIFATELDLDHVRDLVLDAAPADGAPVVMRLTVFDPALQLGHPGAPAHPRTLITMRPAPPPVSSPLRLQSMIASRDQPRLKHGGLFAQLLHRADVQRAGYDDVLLADRDGTISEAATSNIAVIDHDGRLIWPEADVLAGITMQLLNRVRDTEVVTKKIAVADLSAYATVVATNAAVGVRPIASIDDKALPIDDELVTRLRADYESIPPQSI
ncbi:aminotransferase class IV [Nocardia sp. NPDC048505]|uniref:aminotransferase class IV n=1 Tax=Nocardia sp. NPDC048505 TaxID=3155756 RepID=UPI0033CE5DF8